MPDHWDNLLVLAAFKHFSDEVVLLIQQMMVNAN
jgi:hypothetical protein